MHFEFHPEYLPVILAGSVAIIMYTYDLHCLERRIEELENANRPNNNDKDKVRSSK